MVHSYHTVHFYNSTNDKVNISNTNITQWLLGVWVFIECSIERTSESIPGYIVYNVTFSPNADSQILQYDY